MSLIKWEPFDEFDRLFRESLLPVQRGSHMGLDLAVDVYDDGTNIVAEMNLPGLDPEQIDVEVEDKYLHISGRREEVKEKKERNHFAKEIRRGSFQRAVALHDHVEQEQVSAEYKNGVLKVTMPKRARSEEKKVKVEVK